jgi:hypothetical protein
LSVFLSPTKGGPIECSQGKMALKPSVADPNLFHMDPDPAFHFDIDPDPVTAFQFDMDQDPYRFKEVMYLKQYFLYIFT